MSPSRGRGGHRAVAPLLAVALGLAVCAAGPPRARAAGDDLRYQRRLVLPTAGDQIGSGGAVHADRHTQEVFVCDTRNHRLMIFDGEGVFSYQIPGGSLFRAPIDLDVDPDGFILLLARHGEGGVYTLLRLDFDGAFVGVVPAPPVPEGGLLPALVSVALAPDGDRIYAVDEANQRLLVLEPDGRPRRSIDLSEGLPADKARDQILGHVDVYGETVLMAMPTRGVILLYDLDGVQRGSVGIAGTAPCELGFPVAAGLTPDGRMAILDQQRTLFMLWDPERDRCLGEFSGIGDAPGFLYRPADLAVDARGRVYVSQGFEGRVQVFGPPAATAVGSDPAAGDVP